MRRHLLFLLVLVLQSLPARTAEIADATGRSVQIPDRPVRILPAGPPAAVLLGALAPDLMIGWPYSLSPEARGWLPDMINNLPKVPMLTGRQDVTQEVTSLHPDLIFDYGTVSPRYIQLDEDAHTKTGIPTVLLDGALTKTPQTFRELGVALHREERGRVLALEAEAILAAVPPPHGIPLRVVYGLGSDGLSVAAADSSAAEVFNLLGWRVLAPEGTSAIRRTSIDVIASLNPDVLIFQSPGMRQVVAQSSQWRALRAVQEHRAYVMPARPFGWLGEPPSINRLLGVAALSSGGNGTAALAATFYAVVYGRSPTNEQINALRESLQPLSP
jgi:iron complex transport system substrate-binding protein